MSRRRLVKRNPLGLSSSSPVASALTYLGGGAVVGGVLGVVGGFAKQPSDVAGGAVAGASVGVGAASVGGFIIGLVSPRYRNTGFATAGIGLGALILTNLATSIASKV